MKVGVAGLLVAVLRDGVGDNDGRQEIVGSAVAHLDFWLLDSLDLPTGKKLFHLGGQMELNITIVEGFSAVYPAQIMQCHLVHRNEK